jgi:hypothetical protein
MSVPEDGYSKHVVHIRHLWFIHWIDTSVDELLIPDGTTRPKISAPSLMLFIYLYLEFKAPE